MKLALNERRSFIAQAIALWSLAMLSVLGLSLSNPIFASSPFSSTTTVMVDGEIKGKVTADSGEPLIGASIKVKGIDQGAVTDIDGNFSLTFTEGAPVTLIVSYVGYEEQIIKDFVASQNSTNLNISLKATSTNLSTLVVTGYGTRAKRDLTGSVASVQAKDIKEQAVTSFDQALVGKMAGVQVIQTNGAPGGNVSIRIRGVSSISAGNNPLFVIDGIPVTNDTRGATSNGLGNSYEQPFNPLAALNPSDIESIDVLKDAASAAIYGSRGSGGVVLITTKKGKAGKIRVNYDGSYGIQEVNKHVDVLDAYQYAQVVYDGHNNAYLDAFPNGKPTDPNNVRGTNPALQVPKQIFPYLAGQQGLTNTDWQKEVFRKAPMQSHTLSFTGGSENITFLFSGSYFNQDGTIINNNLTRYNTRFRVDAKLDKFRFGINMAPSYSSNQVVNSEGPWFSPNSGVVANALGYAPIFPVTNPDGTYADSVNVWGYGQTNQINPVAVANLTKDRINNFRLLANTYGEYEILDGLKYRLSVATDLNVFRRDYYRPSNLPTPGLVGPSVAQGNSNSSQFTNWLVENTLTYSKQFGNHKIDLLAGYSAQKENQYYNTLTAINFPTDAVQTLNAGQISSGNSRWEQWSLLSILGRVQYNYAGKYFISGSARRDGSSRFGENNRWALFPSVSGAWDVAKENFFGTSNIVNSLKIRASYGATGNFQIPNYGSRAQLSNNNSNYIFGNNVLNNGISITTPANNNLSWENTTSTDIGLDISLFKSALNLTVDYYNSNTTKLLLNLPVPGGSGFSTYLQNIGAMNNRGLEVALGYNKRLGSNFSVDGNINFSTNKNKVTKLGPSGAPIIQTGGTGNTYFITKIGETIASYFVYNVIGVYKDQADLDASPKTTNPTKIGDFKFEDVNKDGKIDANDRKILGNFQPKYTFGFTNTFRYNNFDLNIAIQGSQGFKVMALLNRYFNNVEGNFNNTERVLGYFKSPSDPGTGFVNRANRLATGGNGITSSWHIEDGSYVRVRNLSLGYTFSGEALAKMKVSSARLYFAVTNAFTWTKYTFFNPEISNRPDNSLTNGEDYGSYPLSRTYTFGLNFGF